MHHTNLKDDRLGLVRPATPRDAACIAFVHVTSWQETYTGLLPAATLASLDVQSRQSMWECILASEAEQERTHVFVLERVGEIVGFSAGGAQRDPQLESQGFEGEVRALYVLNRGRGQGGGRSLMTAAASALAADGRRGLALWVLADNQNAQRFYEHLGGEPVLRRVERRADSRITMIAFGWLDTQKLIKRGLPLHLRAPNRIPLPALGRIGVVAAKLDQR